MSDVLLELSAINKAFFGNPVLRDVDFDLRAGQIVALVGTNGAGKSTLSSIIAGIHSPDSGTVRVVGRSTSLRTPRDAEKQGIGMVHQEPSLVEQLTVAENIFLGRELTTPWGTLRRRRMVEESRRVIDSLGYAVDPLALVRGLPLIDKCVVTIARAMLASPRILILDEVTATLNANEVRHLFGVIREIRRGGVGIIFIGHDMKEVVEISDRVVVVRDGRIGGVLEAGPDLGERAIIELMLGTVERVEVDASRHADRESSLATSPPLLRTDSLSLEGTLEDVSLSVRSGEIVGLAGLKGSGITELLFTLFGAYTPTAGRIHRGEDAVSLRDPAGAVTAGIGMITNDRQGEGLALGLTVSDNLVIATLKRFERWLATVSDRRIGAVTREYIDRLRIKTTGPGELVQFLSGGNQQKVTVAKWLLRDVEVLLFDEPTRGVDVRAKNEIYELLLDERDRGKGIVVYSPEVRELLELSDTVLVFAHGRIVTEIRRGDPRFTEHGLLEAIHSQRSESDAAIGSLADQGGAGR